MNIRSIRRVATLILLAACAIAPPAARAAGTDSDEVPLKTAARDTSRFLPRWMHLHAGIGVGWLASPLQIRQLYQAGQGYEAGFEARPARDWRVRLSGEYQTLPLVTQGSLVYTTVPVGKGFPVQDTLFFSAQGNGWMGSGRLEAQKALIPGFWVLGGVGGGYVNSGLGSVYWDGQIFSLSGIFPSASGWALMPTFGAIAESDFLGPTLGLEVRWMGVMRAENNLQSWSVRIGWGGY